MSLPESSGFNPEDAERLCLALKASNEGIWDWWVGKPDIHYSRRILEFLECSETAAPNIFLAPHGLSFDKDGNLFVQDWNFTGRFTKLKKVGGKSS